MKGKVMFKGVFFVRVDWYELGGVFLDELEAEVTK